MSVGNKAKKCLTAKTGLLSYVDEYFDVDPTIVTNGYISLLNIPSHARVLLNGIELSEGISRDYIIQGNDIVFNTPECLEPTDLIKVSYLP